MSSSVSAVAILRSVGGLVFDATFRESHTSEIEVTDNPIETGSSVNDHMYTKPDKLTVAAGVSNSPLHSSSDDQFGGNSRVQAAFNLLRNLQQSGEPFAVQTGLLLYENMMCKAIRAEQDKDTSEVLDFEADFVSVNIVSTQTVTYPTRQSGKTTHQASQTIKKGEQQGKQVTDTNKQSSLASKLLSILRSNSTQ
jgi:hypothetical protein